MATIAIFDSGVGGLSIYQQVIKTCPDHQFVFVSDNHAFPYGTKTEHQLINRVTEVVARLVKEYQPDILIIACNTASTVVLPLLRGQYSIPIVGVVPAIKPAAKLSHTKTIGLLATPGTIARNYTDNLIAQYASDCCVIKVGSSALVEMAEQKMYGQAVNYMALELELAPFLANRDIDVLVLACTHFPLLNSDINHLFKSKGREIRLIDSGKAIANRVSSLSSDLASSKASGMAVFTARNESKMFDDFLMEIGLKESEVMFV